MTSSIRALFFTLASFAFATPALAHPHVWVTMNTYLVYAPDGSITGVRHEWAFDDMFSAFATQGLDAKVKGAFSREELAPLAKVNVESLKEYAYFTYATADGKKAPLTDPAPGYWLHYKDRPFSSISNSPSRIRCISSVRPPAASSTWRYRTTSPMRSRRSSARRSLTSLIRRAIGARNLPTRSW